ncbi:MAG TPA: fatty acid desaturase [Vicinamibacterales bacterium]|nr:fatty acid desaturase [Vicinamibacterales bacterium]
MSTPAAASSTGKQPARSGGTATMAGARPGRYDRVSLITCFFMSLFHIGAVWALVDFTWSGVIVLLVTYYISLAWGIGMSYHRLLTHRSYKTPKPIEYFLTFCATLALEGGPLFWVATHRQHHQYSDADPDPHTPRHGGWWAHIGWIMFGNMEHNDVQRTSRYAPDLAKDPFHRFISIYHWVPLTALGLVLLALGGWNWVLWGVFLRTTLGLHVTWLVNSATHLWGQRRFATRDDSRNNWWVALLSFGEGWHNNHHAHPTSAAHGLAWYELDITYWHIRALELVGLAKHVRRARINEAVEEAA